MLGYFDRFRVEKKLHEPRVSRQITEDYQHTLSHLSLRVKSNRFCVVRQFCTYLSRSDPLTHVPEPLRKIPSDRSHHRRPSRCANYLPQPEA